MYIGDTPVLITVEVSFDLIRGYRSHDTMRFMCTASNPLRKPFI